MGRPRWDITLAILFGPVAINFAISWTLLHVLLIPHSQFLDLYPWLLLGLYGLLVFVVRWASDADGIPLSGVINFRRPKVLEDLVTGVSVCFGVLAIEIAYAYLWSTRLPVPATEFSSNPISVGVTILALPVAAGFVEELVWRGYGITRLQALATGPWKAIVISSLGFGVWHIDLFGFGYAFLGGLLLGFIYYRYKRLLPVVIGHWLYDTVATLLYFV